MNKNNLITLEQKGIALPIIILLVAIVAGLLGYKTYQQLKLAKQSEQKTVVKQVIVRRSKIPNTIVQATTAKTIDVKTGKVITAARVFTLDDKTVYLGLDLDSAKSGTNIDYIRYLNGRYVDHGNSKLSQDWISNISFAWTNSRSLGSIIEGKWKIATYTNGILEKRVSYVVQKDKVAKVNIEEPLATDSDYKLSNVLALK